MILFITYNKKSDKSINLYKQILKNVDNKLLTDNVKKCDIILTIGGDGFLLDCLNNLSIFDKPFYPINGGTVGLLTNEIDFNLLINDIENADKININPLKITINGKVEYAFNEMSILRKSPQAIHLELYINNDFISEIIGDGLIISTPLGSSGYNYSSGGSILPLTSNLMSISPICPIKPRNWRGIIVDNKVKMEIKVKNTNKRPAILNLDNRELGNVNNIYIETTNLIFQNKQVKLLFKDFDKFNLRIIKELSLGNMKSTYIHNFR